MQRTNIFISFSFEKSNDVKTKIEKKLINSNYAINYSENTDRTQYSDETIWKHLKKKIGGSSVMIVIYSRDFEREKGGKALKVKDNYDDFSENEFRKQGWVYTEIRCALRSAKNNYINGIIVLMSDDIWDEMYSKSFCSRTGKATINLNYNIYPNILSHNYGNKKMYLPTCGCCFDIQEDSYIPIVKLSKFMSDPKHYIELVKNKRQKISEYNIKKDEE